MIAPSICAATPAGWRRPSRIRPARFLPLWRLMPLVADGAEPVLAWQSPGVVRDLATEGSVVLLGLEDGRPRFAADVSALTEPFDEGPLGGAGTFEEVRALAPRLTLGEAGIVAQARAMVDWHLRHTFCAVCGANTGSHEGGYLRRCESPACAAEHFPPHRSGRDHDRRPRRNVPPGPAGAFPRRDVLGARRLRRAGREHRGGGAPRSRRGGPRSRSARCATTPRSRGRFRPR